MRNKQQTHNRNIFAVVIAIVAILIMVLVKDVKGLESNDDFKFSYAESQIAAN